MSPLSWSLHDAEPPSAAIEVGPAGVHAARFEVRGGQLTVTAYGSERVPDGAIVPSLTASNIKDRAPVAAAVARVLEQIGKPRRVGLVLPDPVAKISLLKFEQVPAKAQDLEQLIGWQVRKGSPFPLEEGQLTFVKGAAAPDGQEFLVALARRDVLGEYESLCSDAGAHAGLVDVSTFNVANAVLAGEPEAVGADWLLVNVAQDWASVAILRGGYITLLRSRSEESEGTLADLVHQTAMYYEDRQGGSGFRAVMLNGLSRVPGATVEGTKQRLEERLGAPVTVIDPRRAAMLSDRIAASPEFLEDLAPLVGIAVRSLEVTA